MGSTRPGAREDLIGPAEGSFCIAKSGHAMPVTLAVLVLIHAPCAMVRQEVAPLVIVIMIPATSLTISAWKSLEVQNVAATNVVVNESRPLRTGKQRG